MSRSVSFGPFTLDLETRQVVKGDGQLVHISPKAYALLCVLIETRPRALSKTELHERLWPATFVSDATLASLVGELREALGEHGREPGVIRTVHGFGYAFAGPVRESGGPEPAPALAWLVFNGRETPLGDGEHVLGRDTAAALALHSPMVSRQHAKIVVAGPVATLVDLGSKNGTFVRGEPATSPVQLEDGDRIRIGNFELTFRSLTGCGSTETG